MRETETGIFIMSPILDVDSKEKYLHWAAWLRFNEPISAAAATDNIWAVGPAVLSSIFPFKEAEEESDDTISVTVSGRGRSGPSREWVIAMYNPRVERSEAEARTVFVQWLKAGLQGWGSAPNDVIMRPARSHVFS